MNDRPDGRPAGGVPTEPPIPRKNDVLAEICRAIARSANHLDVVQECAVRLQRYFASHTVSLFFEQDGDLVLVGMALPEHLEYLGTEIESRWAKAPADAQRPSVQAMRLRRIVRRDASDPSLPGATRELLRLGSAGGVTSVPIYADGQPIGACVVATPPGQALTAADELLLEDALGVVGIVYQRGVQREAEIEHQSQAIEAHSLAVVGELAAGVAHQVNNPLSAIVHYSEMLLQGRLDAEAREHVRGILEEALRAAGTVRNLQSFARRDVSAARVSTRLDEAIRAVADMERHPLAVSNVHLRLDLPARLPPVRVESPSLRRVLHNLIANARDAIHETRRVGQISVRAEVEGGWARITVEDTGTGLTPLVENAMFRPFFTTKPSGEGTGLGLAVAYWMVREHGGEIRAENWGRPQALGGEPGQGGARVSVWLPVDPDRPEQPEPRAEPAAPAARALDILLVEDEAAVARAVAALLKREGHQVTLCTSAEQAVEVLSRPRADYDVVLSDYRMPGMGGEGLFEWMRTKRPEILGRLVIMTGDMLSARTQALLEGAGRPVLAKPFTLEALRSAIAPRR